MGRTKFYVQFRGRFEASINSLSLLFVWDFHACPSVCVEKDSKKPRPLKIIFFHQFLPKLETHHNQFSPSYRVVLNMERVVIKKPNRMKLVPLGESEPLTCNCFPPTITGTHNRKMELFARSSKAAIHKLLVLSLLTILAFVSLMTLLRFLSRLCLVSLLSLMTKDKNTNTWNWS